MNAAAGFSDGSATPGPPPAGQGPKGGATSEQYDPTAGGIPPGKDNAATTSEWQGRSSSPGVYKAAPSAPRAADGGGRGPDPEAWMREGSFQVDDLPTEPSAITIWRSTTRRNIAVAANRRDCGTVVEWFNVAWKPGTTIHDVIDSGPFGTLDMKIANETQAALIRAKAKFPTNTYLCRLYNKMRTSTVEMENLGKSLNGRQMNVLTAVVYEFNVAREGLFSRIRILQVKCESVHQLDSGLRAWDDIMSAGGSILPQTDLAEMFAMAFDIQEMHTPIWNFHRSSPGTPEAQYDTLHTAAEDVLQDVLRRDQYVNGPANLPALPPGGVPLPGGGVPLHPRPPVQPSPTPPGGPAPRAPSQPFPYQPAPVPSGCLPSYGMPPIPWPPQFQPNMRPPWFQPTMGTTMHPRPIGGGGGSQGRTPGDATQGQTGGTTGGNTGGNAGNTNGGGSTKPPASAPGDPPPMMPMPSADGGNGADPAPSADGQPPAPSTTPRRQRRRPMMSQRFCLNFQPAPIGNGYCPTQNSGCIFVHELITDPADAAIARRIADGIRARAQAD